MKKIMFNDRFGLTDAVLKGCKTMTRRIANKIMVENENQELVWSGGFTPTYKVGEVVAVAQSYSSFRPLISHNDDFSPSHPGWNNKMFVRADLMPHQIRITDIKMERLQDITEYDAHKEGVIYYNCGTDVGFTTLGLRRRYGSARSAFAALIDKISGNGTWENNPYVFAYTFELIK